MDHIRSMRHLEFLQHVADTDVAEVHRKETTYQGSWKRRGGSGVFHNLDRKWTRLESILERWTPQWDVFDAISKDPSGDDGTVLAEVRDLRRYLMLLEAELIARGDVAISQEEEPIES